MSYFLTPQRTKNTKLNDQIPEKNKLSPNKNLVTLFIPKGTAAKETSCLRWE